jgi:hypothetical protein
MWQKGYKQKDGRRFLGGLFDFEPFDLGFLRDT